MNEMCGRRYSEPTCNVIPKKLKVVVSADAPVQHV